MPELNTTLPQHFGRDISTVYGIYWYIPPMMMDCAESYQSRLPTPWSRWQYPNTPCYFIAVSPWSRPVCSSARNMGHGWMQAPVLRSHSCPMFSTKEAGSRSKRTLSPCQSSEFLLPHGAVDSHLWVNRLKSWALQPWANRWKRTDLRFRPANPTHTSRKQAPWSKPLTGLQTS